VEFGAKRVLPLLRFHNILSKSARGEYNL
jgi:hypothetical protein